MNFDISNTVFAQNWLFYAQNFGWKVPILRFLGAEEVSAEASLETVFGQNVILSLAFDWYGSEIAI